MKRLRQPQTAIGLALGAFAAAVLISACGGATDEPGSSTRPSATTAEKPIQLGGTPPEKTDETAPHRRKPEQGAKPGSGAEGSAPKPDGSSKDSPPHSSAPKRADTDGCPPSTDAKRCAEIGAAYEGAKNGDSRVVDANECPSGMDPRTCKEAGEALQQAGEGRVVEPDECPPAMTDQQCAEAGRVYQEAIR